MKRKRTIVADNGDGIVVKVAIETNDHQSLTFNEAEKLHFHLVDDCCAAIRSAPYMGSVPISRMKIS